MNLVCSKCNGKKWYKYDSNHSTVCDQCCDHDGGYWLLQEHYGEDNGKWCCKKGCGHKLNYRDLLSKFRKEPNKYPIVINIES